MKILTFLFLLSASAHEIMAQTDSFDVIYYKAPGGWTKQEGTGVVTWSTVNQQTGGFCIIAAYAATVSSGDATKDFDSEWNRLVVSSFTTTGNPNKQTREAGSWKVVTGAAQVQKDSVTLIAALTVFSGHKKMMSILTSLNDKSYATTVDQFIASIRENRNAIAKANSSSAGNNNSNANTPASQLRGEGVVGTWSTSGAVIANYVTSSGAYAGDASTMTSESYEFRPDGTYLYKFFGYVNRVMYYSETEGIYTVSGDQLSITEKKRKGGYPPHIGDESQFLKKEPKTYKWFIGDYYGTTALHLHNDKDYYINSNFQWQPFKTVK